jgi:hypothetical protein
MSPLLLAVWLNYGGDDGVVHRHPIRHAGHPDRSIHRQGGAFPAPTGRRGRSGARGCLGATGQGWLFFTRIGAFIRWQGGGCGNNGGSDVLALAAARAGSGRIKESGRGEKEDTVTRRWRCFPPLGRRWMTEGSTMMEEEDQMTARRAEPARRQLLLMRGDATMASAAAKGDGLAAVACTRRLDNQP